MWKVTLKGLAGHKLRFALTALVVPANLAGLPALSLPVPADGGVIASLQVIGGSEEQVLAFGRVIEAAVSA